MARKNIFEIVQLSNNQETDVKRIKKLFESEPTVDTGMYARSVLEIVRYYCFANWKSRSHCLNVDDFFEAIKYSYIVEHAAWNVNAYLTFIELVSNFYMLAEKECIAKRHTYKRKENYYLLNTILEDCLSKINYTRFVDEENERVYVVENKPEVSAVAEIVEHDLAIEIIRYNHYLLKGDLKEKRAILLKMYDALEPKKDRVESAKKDHMRNINTLVNNLNIRHNNIDKENPNYYKEVVAQMSTDELEKWYDETYQMILLANLLLDNTDREKKVKDLNDKLKRKKEQ